MRGWHSHECLLKRKGACASDILTCIRNIPTICTKHAWLSTFNALFQALRQSPTWLSCGSFTMLIVTAK
jgi:hypothetical protein